MSFSVGDEVGVLPTPNAERWSRDAQVAMVGLTGKIIEVADRLRSDPWRGQCFLVRFDKPPRLWGDPSEHVAVAQFWFSASELMAIMSRTSPFAENESHADCAEINARMLGESWSL